MKKDFLRVYLVVWLMPLLVKCAAEPTDGGGLCKLRCSDSIIAAKDYVISPLTDPIAYRCNEGVENFLIHSKFAVLKKSSLGSKKTDVAVPSVSITPIVNGIVDGNFGEGTYFGVETDSSAFCSDQCGVISLTVVAKCPGEGTSDLSVSVLSGSLKSDPLVYTVEAPDLQEDDDGSDTGNSSSNSSSLFGDGLP